MWGVGFGRGCAARGGERLGIPERARDAGLGFGDGRWEGSVDSAVVGRCGSGFFLGGGGGCGFLGGLPCCWDVGGIGGNESEIIGK